MSHEVKGWLLFAAWVSMCFGIFVGFLCAREEPHYRADYFDCVQREIVADRMKWMAPPQHGDVDLLTPRASLNFAGALDPNCEIPEERDGGCFMTKADAHALRLLTAELQREQLARESQGRWYEEVELPDGGAEWMEVHRALPRAEGHYR